MVMLGCGLPNVAVDLGGGATPKASAPSTPKEPVANAPATKQAPSEPGVSGTGVQPEKPEESVPNGLIISDLNTVPPEDAAKEMYTYGQGGGPGGCMPPADGATVTFQIPGPVLIDDCWNDTDTKVTVTVTGPDGEQDSATLPVINDGGLISLSGAYQFNLSRPVGTYTLQIEGAAQKVAYRLEVEAPELPMLYDRSTNPFMEVASSFGPRHTLEGAGFGPNELLRLWAYQLGWSMKLLGWRDFTARPDGSFRLDVTLPAAEGGEVGFVVTGPASGEVHQTGVMSEASSLFKQFRVTCAGALPTRLKGGGDAVALRNMNLRELPNTSAKVAASIQVGDQMAVAGGPFCVDGRWWWSVSYKQFTNYFVAENTAGNYLLEPVNP